MCAWPCAKKCARTKERPSLSQEITVFKHQWDRICVTLMTWIYVASKPHPHLSSSFCEALKATFQVLFFSIVWKLKHKIVCNYQQLSEKFAWFCLSRINFIWESLLEVETKMLPQVLCGNKKLVFFEHIFLWGAGMLLQSLVTSIHQQWRIIHPEALGSLDKINLRKSQAYLTLLLQTLWGTILPLVLYSVFKKW